LSFQNRLNLFKSKSKLYYDRQSVGQSVLESGTHLGPASNFSYPLFDYFFDSFGSVDVGRHLWREVGSVLFSFCRASPAQPFSDLSPTALMSIVSCFYFWDPQPGRPGSCIYFPQEQGSPIIPLGIRLDSICLGNAQYIPVQLSTYLHTQQTNKLRGLSPRANYTYRETAVCQQS
jgi:hypothetical protein